LLKRKEKKEHNFNNSFEGIDGVPQHMHLG